MPACELAECEYTPRALGKYSTTFVNGKPQLNQSIHVIPRLKVEIDPMA